jgi:hypothetical protein
VTVKLWQLVAAIATATLLVGVGFGRYVVPNDPVNRTGSEFEQHMNDAFMARRGSKEAQQRIAERYGATTNTPEPNADTVSGYVRAAIPALEAWNADHGGYTGVTLPELRLRYDAGVTNVEIRSAGPTTYCVQSTVGSISYFKAGPAADVLPGTC